jgi:hypothetical protein
MDHLIIAVVAVLLVAIVAGFRRRRAGLPARPASDRVEDLAAWSYDQAIADARENHAATLDGTDASVEQVEAILDRIAATGKKADGAWKSGVVGMAIIYGFYIGECIRRNHGGTWASDHSVAGEKSFPFTHAGGDSFPTGWARKRIENGPEDNVWHKYRVLVIDRLAGTAKGSVQPPTAPASDPPPLP